jgi:hypothetical protein
MGQYEPLSDQPVEEGRFDLARVSPKSSPALAVAGAPRNVASGRAREGERGKGDRLAGTMYPLSRARAGVLDNL